MRMVGVIQLGKEQFQNSATAEDFSGSWNGQSVFPGFLFASLVFSFAGWLAYFF